MSNNLVKMGQSSSMLSASTLDDTTFLQMMSQLEMGRRSVPTPKTIRFNGSTGVYEERRWNNEAKKMENLVYGIPNLGFMGVILMVRWYVRWKYDEKKSSEVIVRTPEFQTFDEPITLERYTYVDQKEKRQTLGLYPNYQALKAAYVMKDVATGKEFSPYDLWASVYILDVQSKEVINLRLKGKSQKNLWDYFSNYKIQLPDAVALAQTITKFGSEIHKMNTKKDDGSDSYCAATFKAMKLVEPTSMTTIKTAVTGLVQWMQSLKVQNEVHEEEVPIVPNDCEPILVPEEEVKQIDFIEQPPQEVDKTSNEEMLKNIPF